MRLKLFLLVLLSACLPMIAQTATITGVVVNSTSGSPVGGAQVMLRSAGAQATTTFNGDFRLTDITPGADYLVVICDGYNSAGFDVTFTAGTNDLGSIRLEPLDDAIDLYGDQEDLMFDEAVLEDESESSQGIAALTGANDDIFYNTASYNFGPM